jgi:hypothetical protein
MNKLSANEFAKNQETTSTPDSARITLVITAWVATLLLSKLPLVIVHDLIGIDIPWIVPAWLGLASLLFATTFVWPSLKPLRIYFTVMGVIYLWTMIDSLIRGTAFWKNLMNGQPEMVMIFGDRVLLLLNAFLIIAVLILMGTKRRDVFLAVGNLNAPVGGKTADPRRRRLSWSILVPVMAILLGGLFFTFLVSQTPAGFSNISAIIP